MKKFKTIIVILVSLFLIDGCSPDEDLTGPDLTIDQILGGKEMTVYKGMLTFKDKSTFDNLASDFIKRDEAFIRTWEKQLGFKSLYTIYEDAIVEEDRFLEEMVKKYGAESEVTRDEMGYSKMTQKYLESGTLLVSNDGFLDMNVTVASLAPLINADGFVRVGNEIRQYTTDFVKIILDGDYNKMDELVTVKESGQNIHVGTVKRQLNKISDVSRTQALSSCESTVGNHRLIAYEELTGYNAGGSPCLLFLNDYNIKVRSLKRILGSWQNFSTSQITVMATYCIHHLNCDFTLNRVVKCETNQLWSGGSGSTVNNWLIRSYDSGPCVSSTSNCTGIGVLALAPGFVRAFSVTGVNGTACSMP